MDVLIYMAIGVVFTSAMYTMERKQTGENVDFNLFSFLFACAIWPLIILLAIGGWIGDRLSSKSSTTKDEAPTTPSALDDGSTSQPKPVVPGGTQEQECVSPANAMQKEPPPNNFG